MRKSPRTKYFAFLASIVPLAGAALAAEPQVVQFTATDGVRITADYYAPPNKGAADAPVAILLHQYRSDRRSWEPLIPALQARGLAVLALDLRGHGDSAATESREAVLKRDPQIFKQMQEDVRGAYDWLAVQPGLDRARFVLIGASVGCSIALQYAARDRSVDGVVCLSPGTNYMELDSVGEIRQITGRRILLLATEDERDAPYSLQKAGRNVDVEILKGFQAHGTAMFAQAPKLADKIADFVQKAVGEPTTTTVCGSIEKNIYHQPESGWAREIAATNLRYYSSPAEAEARGLRAAKSDGPKTGGGPAPDGRARPGGKP
jgi:pimeloyl-ACP methyl ester carboxylesterase